MDTTRYYAIGLSSAFLFEQTCFILNNIRKARGNPVAIIVDGNRVNQSFFKKFDLTNPWFTNDGIVLLYDYVHLPVEKCEKQLDYGSNKRNKLCP